MKTNITLLLFCLLLAPFAGNASPGQATALPTERMLLLTDRDVYVAGDMLLYSARLFNSSDRASTTSRFAYISLRGKEIIAQQAIELDNGYSHGSMFLPDTLSTGYYELTAFTNWMRNEGETIYFRRQILVVNRFDKDFANISPRIVPDSEAVLSFFPEGQQFVTGAESRLLVVASGAYDASYRNFVVIDQLQDTLVAGRLNAGGFAELSLTPVNGNSYYLLMEGSSRRFQLPQAKPSGMGLTVKQQNQLLLANIINAGETSDISLELFRQGRIVERKSLRAVNGNNQVQFDLSSINEGLIALRVSEKGRQTGIRWFYFSKPTSMPSVLSNESFRRRDKVGIQIQPGDVPIAQMSATVVKAELASYRPVHMLSYKAILDLHAATGQDLQSLIRIYGNLDHDQINSRIISETSIPEFNIPVLSGNHTYAMEVSRQLVSGTVTNMETGQPAANTRLLLNTPDTVINLMYTQTNQEGYFQFILTPYYNNKELFVIADPTSTSGRLTINLHDKFRFSKPAENKPFPGIWHNRNAMSKSQEVANINKAYQINWMTDSQVPPTLYFPPPRLFSRPNMRILPELFEPLDDLREIARELIHPWRIRQSGAKHVHSLVCATTKAMLPGTPMLFVDGVAVFDIDDVMHLGSRQIKEVQVHNLNWVHGEMEIPGLIGIFTNTQEFEKISYSHSFLREFHEAPVHPKRFLAPVYTSMNDHVSGRPDLRETLYWNPDVVIRRNGTAQLEFYTGDLSGDYLIKIEGITADNQVFSITKPLTVVQ